MSRDLVSPPKAVESYLNAFRQHDLGDVPFAPSVIFESPLTARLVGIKGVLDFLTRLVAVIHDVRAVRQFVEDEYVAVQLDLHTAHLIVPSFELLQVSHGLIRQVRAFHDPRPILRALAATGRPLSTEKKEGT